MSQVRFFHEACQPPSFIHSISHPRECSRVRRFALGIRIHWLPVSLCGTSVYDVIRFDRRIFFLSYYQGRLRPSDLSFPAPSRDTYPRSLPLSLSHRSTSPFNRNRPGPTIPSFCSTPTFRPFPNSSPSSAWSPQTGIPPKATP